MLADTFEVLGRHVEDRLEVVEEQVARQATKLTKVDELESLVQTLTTPLDGLAEKVEDNDIKHTNSENVLQAKIEATGQGARVSGFAGSPAGPSASQSAAAADPQVPHETRTLACIGNLGWDTPRADLLERAKEVLNTTGVDPASFTAVSPMTGRSGKGSAAEVAFRNHSDLQTARLQIRVLHKQYQDGRQVWLDVKRDQAQNRRNRAVHRLADVLEDIEQLRPDAKPMTKMLGPRVVKVDGHRAAYFVDEQVRWTPWALARYSTQDMDSAGSYARGA